MSNTSYKPIWHEYLNEWITYKELSAKLLEEHAIHLNQRDWTRIVENHNSRFCNLEIDKYIAHSVKGYKLTSDTSEILNSVDDLNTRALNMLSKRSKAIRALKLRHQKRLL